MFYVKPGVTEDKLRSVFADVEASLSCDQRKAVQWILLGDFNFPKVRWESISSPHSDEQKLLEFLCNDLLLTQIIDLPTHKLGSISGSNFLLPSRQMGLQYCKAIVRLCSDHYPFLLINVDIDYQYASGHAYRISSFKEAKFSSHLTLSQSFTQECHNLNQISYQRSIVKYFALSVKVSTENGESAWKLHSIIHHRQCII